MIPRFHTPIPPPALPLVGIWGCLTLVLARDPVLGHVRVDHGPGLQEELPEQGLADLLVQSPHVHRGICGEQRSEPGHARDNGGLGADTTQVKPPEPEGAPVSP